MPFGLISSQDIFQRCMDDLLEDLPKVNPIADDVKIHGCSEIEHDVLLLDTLERCRRAGLNLNYAKCDIKKDSIKFFGNILSTAGMKPDVNKVKAIIDVTVADSLFYRNYVQLLVHVVFLPLLSLAPPSS